MDGKNPDWKSRYIYVGWGLDSNPGLVGYESIALTHYHIKYDYKIKKNVLATLQNINLI